MAWDDWDDSVEYGFEDEPDYEDGPEEFLDNPEETEEALVKELEDRGIWWGDSIARIRDPELQQEAIERADELMEEREDLSRQIELGEIDDYEFWARNWDLHGKAAKRAFQADLDSIELGSGELGEISEEYDMLIRGDLELMDINDRVNERVKADPESAQETADRMHEEGRLSEEAYDLICEKVNRYRRAR